MAIVIIISVTCGHSGSLGGLIQLIIFATYIAYIAKSSCPIGISNNKTPAMKPHLLVAKQHNRNLLVTHVSITCLLCTG